MTIMSPQQYCLLGQVSDDDLDRGYSALPADLLAAEQAAARHSEAAALMLNKSLCGFLLAQFSLTAGQWTLPEQFSTLYREQLQRIEAQLATQPDSYFSLGNDPFRKDLAILRHRLVPCGAEFATPFSGISRRLLFGGGWRQALRFLRVMAACRGVAPFLELHMHPAWTHTFNPEGWLETYENLADLLAANPSLRGVQSTSWFLDPALEQVSPRLVYLRRVPERCGAVIFHAGEDSDSSGALATSPTRRALHAAGRYQPRRYTRIWPRQRLLQRGWRNPAVRTLNEGHGNSTQR